MQMHVLSANSACISFCVLVLACVCLCVCLCVLACVADRDTTMLVR